MRERLGILISGGGTTMQEIIKATQSGELPMDIGVVIASRSDIGGIKKAKVLGLQEGKDIVVVDPAGFRGDDGKVDQYGFGQALGKVLKGRGATVVSQNGWLPLTPENVIDQYSDSIFNQHPGPKRETRATHGTQPHAVMLYVARATGRNEGTDVIVHRVTPKWDDGLTVGIKHVPIYLPHDHPGRLQRRALKVEHRLQIEHLIDVAKGNVKEVSDNTYIRHGEELILKDARKHARRLYPKG